MCFELVEIFDQLLIIRALQGFRSISFGGERNGTQRKAADGLVWLKINCVPLNELKCHNIV